MEPKVIGASIRRDPVNKQAALITARAPWYAHDLTANHPAAAIEPAAPTSKKKHKTMKPDNDIDELATAAKASQREAQRAQEIVQQLEETKKILQEVKDSTIDISYSTLELVTAVGKGIAAQKKQFLAEADQVMATLKELRRLLLSEDVLKELERLYSLADALEKIQKARESGVLDALFNRRDPNLIEEVS